MTKNLFKKAAMFTDIHFGAKNNSELHNNDCEQFVKWFVEESKKRSCETCFFLGDWHHNRATLGIETLHRSYNSIKLLSESFEQVFFIAGNHDLYRKSDREIHSVEWASEFSNVKVITDWFKHDNVTIAPWLIGDDWKKLIGTSGKYLFSHMEVPGFILNGHIEMPDHGEINTKILSGWDTVFSGHFHKRQKRGNIQYIGNAFPHNYSDAGDTERGATFLQWGGDLEFLAWPMAPHYNTIKLSEMINNPTILRPRGYYRVDADIDLNFEEAQYIRENFIKEFDLRELNIIPRYNIESNGGEEKENTTPFESIDSLIVKQIEEITSNGFDKNILLDIYKNL
jgi:DNA repair exonuclease SbcCD nuclease subunit